MYKVAELVCDYLFYTVPRRFYQAPVERYYLLVRVAAAPARCHGTQLKLRKYKAVIREFFVYIMHHISEYLPAYLVEPRRKKLLPALFIVLVLYVDIQL